MKEPNISWVVGAEDHGHEDFNFLSTLLKNPDYTDLVVELITVRKDDGLPEGEVIVEEDALGAQGGRILRLRVGQPKRSARRNLAAAHATAPILMFAAGDCEPIKGTFEAHVEFHRSHPDVKTVGIGAANFSNKLMNNIMEWADRTGNQWGAKLYDIPNEEEIDFFYGSHSSMKRELFEEVGPFDEAFPYNAGEDYDMGLRLKAKGARFFFLEKAELIHHHLVTKEERIFFVRQSGMTTPYLDLKYGEGPWQNDLNYSLFRLWGARNLFGLRYLLMGKKKDRDKYYWYLQRLVYCRAYQRTHKNPPDWALA